ncbi:glycoside hydrolase family 16 protein [Moniliophthora roreri]|nr:glycoside hydrolase family 16 protein [Moniliophthora roreri]
MLFSLPFLLIVFVVLQGPPGAHADTTVIPSNSFSSTQEFKKFWNYLYPWRQNPSDHNGTNVEVSSGILTLRANPISNPNPPNSREPPHLPIHYASGAVHAKETITITKKSSWTIYGEFIPPIVNGMWPAFWLTSAEYVNNQRSWPPECDIGEWKGKPENWFNTYNTSRIIKSDIVPWPNDKQFHSLKAVITAENDADVRIDFYLDNALKTTQYGANFVNVPMSLIINLQTEGSSGSPGPKGTTIFQVRNVKVTRS